MNCTRQFRLSLFDTRLLTMCFVSTFVWPYVFGGGGTDFEQLELVYIYFMYTQFVYMCFGNMCVCVAEEK